MKSYISRIPTWSRPFFFIGIAFGILNTITVNSVLFSAIVTIIEYGIVFRQISKNNYFAAFIYSIQFIALSVELNTFVFGDSAAIRRSTFQDGPLVGGYLYMLILFLIYYKIRSQNKNEFIDNNNANLRKWLLAFLGCGLVSAFIGYIFNDNGIQSGPYPKVIINETLNYINRILIILSAIEITKKKYDELSIACIFILISVVLSALVTTFVFGMTGWYSDYVIMLTPLAIGLTPFLICFNKNHTNSILPLLCGILIIIATFAYPTAIGSKWYLIIAAAIVEFIILYVNVKSIWSVCVIGLCLLIVISNYAEPLLDLMGNEYVGWKLSQAINLLNFSSETGLSGWYEGLDHSTLYRVDELHNIFIEYVNKPIYALLGKGFAGTTLHHTNLLAWETDPGAFPISQVNIGAYYGMHETFAVIFLRHGIMGCIFIFLVIKKLIGSLVITPWSMVALVWFFFYWAYGMSLTLGSIALVLAFYNSSKEKFIWQKL